MTGAARDPGTSANFRYTTSTDMTPPGDIGDPGTRGHAKAGRVARFFYLPSDPPFEHEQFVDFYWIQPAAVFELLSIRRVASMTDAWQAYLQRALDRSFSWEDRKQTVDRPSS